MLCFEAGAFYVMDRGYLDFSRLFALHQTGAFLITRAKRGMDARRVYSLPTDRSTRILCDQRVALNGFYAPRDYPEQLRRIRFKDPASGKSLVFLTNNTALPALTIAALYTLLQILSVSVFEKTQLSQAFAGSGQLSEQPYFANQLNLLDI